MASPASSVFRRDIKQELGFVELLLVRFSSLPYVVIAHSRLLVRYHSIMSDQMNPNKMMPNTMR